MILLNCVMVGEGSAISIMIEEWKTVALLKDAIKEKNSATIKCDAKDLQLFLAKTTNGEWLDGAGAAAVTLDEHGHLQGFEQMEPLLWLKNDKYFGDKVQLDEGQVHVLVVAHEPRDRQLAVDGVSIHGTTNTAVNPPALVAFWKAFQADPSEVIADAVVALPEGTFLLGDSTHGSRIYIRRCYPQLLKVCWDMIHDEATNTPHLVILGNPGIGKTYFGYVILLHLARIGATVVYESGGTKKRLLFSREVVVRGSQQDFVDILDQPTTYYIVDAVKPTYYPAKTILLTSPRRSIWYEFNKTNCRSRYMPVWSKQEILKCRDLIYSDTPVLVVQDRFRRWGGIARYVLRYAQLEDQQVLLEKAIAVVDVDWLVDACGKLDADDAQVSHRLLHYRVSKSFANEYLVFASQYVQQEVYNRLYVKDKQKLVDFISASDGIGALAVLRGHLFEGYVHSVLPRGGSFRVRRLIDNSDAHHDAEYLTEEEWDEGDGEGDDDAMDSDDDDVPMEDSTAATWDLGNGVVTILLPERSTVVFNNDHEVIAAADRTTYLRPVVKNYKSVDALIKPDVLFQVTGAHKHPCKQKGLHDVLKLLGNPAEPRLYFVLPPDRFTNFRYQRYLNSDRKRMTMPSYVNVRKIQQFAMEVKLVLE